MNRKQFIISRKGIKIIYKQTFSCYNENKPRILVYNVLKKNELEWLKHLHKKVGSLQ